MKRSLLNVSKKFVSVFEKPAIIQVNVNGKKFGKEDSVNVPITNSEIVSEVKKCFEEGASIFEVCCRDVQGNPSVKIEEWRNLVKAIKEEVPEAILKLSTGGIIDGEFGEQETEQFKFDLVKLAKEESVEYVTFTTGSSNMDGYIDQNWPKFIREMGKTIMDNSPVRAEAECFDAGHIENATFLQKKKGFLKPEETTYNFVTGTSYGLRSDLSSISHMIDLVPEGGNWTATGIEDMQYNVATVALVSGGNVNVGLGNNLYLPDGETPATNVEQVEIVKKIAGEVGRKVASIDETREILGLVKFNDKEWGLDDIPEMLKDPSLVSPTLAINEKSRKLREEGHEIYKVGFGESPFPIPESVIDELKVHAHRNSYENIQGVDELREACAYHLYDEFGYDHFDADRIFIGVGSKTILADVVKCLDCEVTLCSPAWVTYYPQSIISGKKIEFVHTKVENNHLPTAEQLEELWSKDPNKRRLLVLNSPSNPTGIAYTHEELATIVPVLRKYKVIVLSDEIYALFHEEGERPASLAQKDLYPERTIVTNGLSKVVGGGGWRLGFGAFPEELAFMIPTIKTIASHYYSCVPGPIQYASIKAFDGNPEVKKYLRLCRKILDPLRDHIYNEITGAGIKMGKPNSAFYGYPVFEDFGKEMEEVFGIKTGEDFSEVLLEQFGVAVLPGSKFLREDKEFGFRMCFTDFDGKEALVAAELYEEEGKEIDREFLDKYCTNVMIATDKIVEFTNMLK